VRISIGTPLRCTFIITGVSKYIITLWIRVCTHRLTPHWRKYSPTPPVSCKTRRFYIILYLQAYPLVTVQASTSRFNDMTCRNIIVATTWVQHDDAFSILPKIQYYYYYTKKLQFVSRFTTRAAKRCRTRNKTVTMWRKRNHATTIISRYILLRRFTVDERIEWK